MSAPLSQYDVSNVEANGVPDPVPAGWYLCNIVESEMKPTKNGQGAYLQLVEQVVDGPHKGRKFYDRLNLQNNNATAVEIAFSTLKSIYLAVGLARADDSAQLHGIVHKVKVKVKPAEGNYSAGNEIVAYDTAASAHPVDTGNAGPVVNGTPASVPQGAQPWAQPAAQAAPPLPPQAAPAPAAPVAHTMTAKANGASYEDFVGQGWTDQQLVDNGYMEAPAPAVPATPPAAPAVPTAPAQPAPAPAATPAAPGSVPPWAR